MLDITLVYYSHRPNAAMYLINLILKQLLQYCMR